MASQIGGRNNCPTSDRDGPTVHAAEERAALAEIESAHFIVPSDYDRRMLAATEDSPDIFVPDDDHDFGPDDDELEPSDAELVAALNDMPD